MLQIVPGRIEIPVLVLQANKLQMKISEWLMYASNVYVVTGIGIGSPFFVYVGHNEYKQYIPTM
jgi:hypothetical protein